MDIVFEEMSMDFFCVGCLYNKFVEVGCGEYFFEAG